MLKKHILLFLLLGVILSYSQNLDDRIYSVTAYFNRSVNIDKLTILERHEIDFKTQLKTPNDYLAFTYLLCNKAYYLKMNREIQNAIISYQKADELFFKQQLHKVSDYDIIEYCLKPLGNLYTKTGNFTNAETIINRYIVIASKGANNSQVTSGKINLSKLYQTLNMHKSVVQITNEVLRTQYLSVQQQHKLEVIKQTSLLALKKDASISFLNKEVILSNPLLVFSRHKNKAVNYLQKNKNEKALKELLKARSYLNIQEGYLPRDKAKFYVELAKIQLLNNLIPDAKTSLDDALKLLLPDYTKSRLPNKETLYVENTFIDIFDLYATIQLNEIDALNFYDLSFYISDLLLATIQDQQTKILHQASRKNRSEKCISLLYEAYMLSKNSAYIVKAFMYAENSKASVLQETIERKQNQLLYISELQHKLANDKTILNSYFYGTTAMYQFVISPEIIKFYKIDNLASLKENLSTYTHLFDTPDAINNNISLYRDLAEKLYLNLGFNKLDEIENLIISPDGLLHFLPFETLLTKSTTTTSYAKMPFLIQGTKISYAINSLAYTTNVTIPSTPNVLGVFPVFKNTAKELTYSLEEAKAIQKAVRSLMLENNKATKETFIKESKMYNVLHFSTHASGGDFNSSATIDFYDDTMPVEKLYLLKMNPNLVVLSACETGVGKVLKGEGAMSIARGFQYAGVKNVLFSLWKVNDLSTSKLMQSFYENYVKHLSASLANQQSKLAYLQNSIISNTKKSPYYWASFVYYGSAYEKMQKKNYSFLKRGLFILILIYLIIYTIKFINSIR